MNEGNRITDRPQLESIPEGSAYLVESGDGSGTKYIKHEDLVKKMNGDLSIGDIDDLKELDKLEDQDEQEEPGVKGKLTFVKAILKVLGIVTAVFKGTDGIKAGTAGMVPPPGPEDEGKVLGAEGKWVTAGTGGNVDAGNVKFADGMTAEEKVGMIEGATADLNCENENMVAMMSAVKQVNDSLKWKLVGEVSGSDTISLPSTFSELLIIGSYSSNVNFPFNVPYDFLPDSGTIQVRSGYYRNGTPGAVMLVITITKKTANIAEFYLSGDSILSSAKLRVYYR